jgi:hypothetical protein
MAMQHLRYEKHVIDDTVDLCWRVVVEEAPLIAVAPKTWSICDITYHDTECEADGWLDRVWGLKPKTQPKKAIEFIVDSSKPWPCYNFTNGTAI